MKRREFLQSTLAGATGLGLSSTAVSAPMQTSVGTTVNYAIVGLGFFSGYVLPRIQRSTLSRATALVTSDAAKARDWCEKHKLENCSIYTYDEMAAIRDDPLIDAVYIATPVGTHAKFAIEALESGKHVITEKTMAASVDEGKAMIDAARRADRKLMVAYRARYEAFNQQAIRYSRERTYGKINSIAAHKGFVIGDRLGKNSWRTSRKLAGGGALVDIGIYSIQACRYIAGVEPIEVCAFSSSTPDDPRFSEVEESVAFMLRFPEGLLATGSASWNYSLQNYYRVGATEANFVLDPATSNGNLRMLVNTMNPRESAEKLISNSDQIAAEFDHFSGCILNDNEPLTDGEEGLKDLIVIEALYESIRGGKAVTL